MTAEAIIVTLVITIVGAFVVRGLIWCARYLRRRKRVFLSAPMSEDPKTYEVFRSKIMEIFHALKAAGYDCHSAISSLPNPNNFEQSASNTRDLFKKIRSSKHFILIYIDPTPTGSLVEAGYALAKKRNCIFITTPGSGISNQTSLPWILDGLDHVPQSRNHVRRLKFDTIDAAIAEFQRNAKGVMER
ncbi:hypothetical protein [Hyphobacterium marinum]|uniref:Uncharacterized protein n=1 Tax=Hyphobacterium marinum TaxID=3116574 RepID=A0ABU7M006_9PROT|nr:hypothetical protein [Hyphobacterium sp. Y6023]MEE2567142.1 hypothetical protein [Hyphobacterium sp. Y6023]